jgi:hypothetical protein
MQVQRRTRTQFVLEGEARFRRATGEEIGGMHDRITAAASVEEIAAFELEAAARNARELELREEERDLRKLIAGFSSVTLSRRHGLYLMILSRVKAAQVRAIFAAFKGAK